MGTDDTGDSNRDQILEAMGPEMGRVFHLLHDELVWLNMRWALYKQLFTGSSTRIDLLNETAGTFFFVVQGNLWDDVVLGLARLTDPAKSRGGRGSENLSLAALHRFIEDPALRRDFEELLERARATSDCVRPWRDKRIAHRDLEVALAGGAGLLPKVSREHVESALLACGEAMNVIDMSYRRITVGYEYSNPGARDGDALVYYLNRGHRAEREFEERLRSGDVRPEEFEQDDDI
ncbi:MAG: AbiU2 domain-containing protein [Thermoleophilia bacterium]